MPTVPRPFIPVINGIKVEMRMLQDLQHIENVFWFQASAEVGLANVQDAADAVAGWWHDTLRPLQSSQIALLEVRATDFTTENSWFAINTDFQGVVGGRDQPVLPANVSVAVHLGCNRTGRSFQGRVFHVGLCKDQVDNSTVSPGAVGSLQIAYTTLLTQMNLAGTPWSIASFMSNKLWRSIAVTTPVTSISVEQTTDSQKRRLPGRGR